MNHKNFPNRISTKQKLLISALLFLLPVAAFANAGTALMWAGMLHLVFGNIIIGILEGYLLIWLFGVKTKYIMRIMIAANYFSAWFGGLYLCHVIQNTFFHITIYNAVTYYWIMVLITYIITLLLEYPFVLLIFRKNANKTMVALKASLIIQTVSYLLLICLYFSSSVTSLYKDTHQVKLHEMHVPENIILYYISEKDGDVYKNKLSDNKDEKVFDLNSKSNGDCLHLITSSDKATKDLVARVFDRDSATSVVITIARSIPIEKTPSYINPDKHNDDKELHGNLSNYGQAPILGKEGPWKFGTIVWAAGGLFSKSKQGDFFYIADETPFGFLFARNATNLMGEMALFQLGNNQICLFDPETRNLALIAEGRGPVVILEDSFPQELE